MRILVVEDEHKIAQSIKKGLEQESYAVDLAFNGTDGLDLALSGEFDLIILDRLLPGMDGVKICQKVRQKNIHTPVLILTAKGQIQDRVEGLDAGADDYLIKPFAFEELLARIRALKRRPKDSLSNILEVEDLTLDATNFEVRRGQTQIRLSNKEFALLEYLMRHKNKILTKDQIISHIWSYDDEVLPNNVEVYIGYLRKKIDLPFKNQEPLIKTIRGFGYKLGN